MFWCLFRPILMPSPGQTGQTRPTGDRRAVREKAQRCRGRTEDVSDDVVAEDTDQHWSSAQSTLTNKSRLKLLHRREEHLQELFSSSRSALLSLAKDETRYTQFLEGVIVQGYLQIMEPSVTVHSRKRDVDGAKQAAESAARTFKEISGRDIEFDIEGTLSDDGYVYT